MRHIGESISSLIKSKGLTVPELASRMNMSVRGVYHIIKKEHADTKVLDELASILDVPITYFIDGEKEDPAKNALLSQLNELRTAYDELKDHYEKKCNEVSRIKKEIEIYEKRIIELQDFLEAKKMILEYSINNNSVEMGLYSNLYTIAATQYGVEILEELPKGLIPILSMKDERFKFDIKDKEWGESGYKVLSEKYPDAWETIIRKLMESPEGIVYFNSGKGQSILKEYPQLQKLYKELPDKYKF